MSSGFLHKYFLNNPSKRLHKWVHYFDIYERHLERFRGRSPVMLEIGVMGGGSLAMWKSYLGTGAKLVGLDIDPNCKRHEGVDIEVVIGSQDDPMVLQSIMDRYPDIDVILDDGSHMSPHMIASFEAMYGHVSPYGVYIVEDTHTNYWPEYGGAVKGSDTFMEFTKDKLDEINAFHTRGAIPVSQFAKTTDSISIYDSVVVFEKRPQGSRQAFITIGSSLPPEDASQA